LFFQNETYTTYIHVCVVFKEGRKETKEGRKEGRRRNGRKEGDEGRKEGRRRKRQRPQVGSWGGVCGVGNVEVVLVSFGMNLTECSVQGKGAKGAKGASARGQVARDSATYWWVRKGSIASKTRFILNCFHFL
jgi:hypothetical protein